MMIPYTHFGKAIVRTPAFSTNASFDEIVQSEEFKDAVYYASPDLFDLWESGKINEVRKNTLRKYSIRAKSRCTPFGLFSACSAISITDASHNTFSFCKKFDKGHLRLDYNALSYLSSSVKYDRVVEDNPVIYLNSSLYKVGAEVRFIHYTLDANAQRHYSLTSYEIDEVLSDLMNLMKAHSEHYNNLLLFLQEKGYLPEDANAYLLELLGDKFLITREELSTVLSSDCDPIFQSLMPYFSHTELFYDVQEYMSQHKCLTIGKTRFVAKKMNSLFVTHFPSINRNQVLQIDMSRDMTGSALSSSVIENIISVLPKVVKIAGTVESTKNRRLQNFVDNLEKRYDRQRVSLLVALDPDYGIGYDDLFCWESSGLLRGLPFAFKSLEHIDNSNVKVHYRIAEMDDLDPSISDTSDIDWSKYPETMSIFCSLFKDSANRIVLFLRNVGGSSALNTLSRFAYLSESICTTVQGIADFEQSHAHNGAKYSTIDILPNVRAGNVMRRPMARNHSISFPCDSSPTIRLNQLYVSVNNGRLILTDETSSEVIPCIDNALIYDNCNLSAYKFLCDLQMQNQICSLFRHPFDSDYISYIPRISFGNIIIHREEWRIHKDKSLSDAKILLRYLQQIHVPDKCVIIEGDNELRVDISNNTDLDILYSYYKKKPLLILCEDLLSIYECIIKDEQGLPYANEIIIPIHRIYD